MVSDSELDLDDDDEDEVVVKKSKKPTVVDSNVNVDEFLNDDSDVYVPDEVEVNEEDDDDEIDEADELFDETLAVERKNVVLYNDNDQQVKRLVQMCRFLPFVALA